MRKSWLVSTSLIALASSGAFAQSQPGSAGIEEVVVTAQRRAQGQEHSAVPLSVVRGSDIANAGIVTADRLQNIIPALTVEPSSTGNILFMRGVGNFTVIPASDPAIAFNYDGIYIGRPTSISGIFYDLDRLEVLKGPQGILYGRNATGGAINVLPTQPVIGEPVSGNVSLSYGNYNAIVAQGAFNAPLGDNAAMRLAVSESSHDGYLKDGTDDDQTTSVRLQFKDNVTSNLTIRVAGDYSYTGGTGQSVSYLNSWICPNNSAAAAVGSQAAPCSIRAASGINLDQGVYTAASQAWRESNKIGGPAIGNLPALAPYPFVDNTFYGANAELTYDTGFGVLTEIVAWRAANLNYFSDAAAFGAGDQETDTQFSNEIRFTGKRIGFVDYTVGFYYYDEKIKDSEQINLTAQASWLEPNYGTESYAPFAELTFNVTDQIRLVSGARYTNDHKTINSDYQSMTLVCQVPVGTVCSQYLIPFAPSYASLAGKYISSLPALGTTLHPNLTYLTPNHALPDYLSTTDTTQVMTLNNSRVTYREAAEWDVTPDSMAYASFETGYRSGGFSSSYSYPTYQPEYITAYTIGLKNRFFDHTLQLNIEAFHWDYENQQVNHVSLDPITGSTANYTSNVGKSRMQGAEVDAIALVTPTTLVSADIQYLDSVYKSYVYSAAYTIAPTGVASPLTGCPAYKAPAPAPAAAGTYIWNIDCSGRPAYNSPKWTVNLALQQTVDLGSIKLSNYELLLGANAQYKSSYVNGFAYLSDEIVQPTWTADFSVQFQPKDEDWSVAAYVRNVTDNQTPVYSTFHPLSQLSVATISPPRTFGFRLTKKF